MQIITGTRDFQIEEPTVVTLGKFDGRHKGHQKLLRELLQQKEEKGLKAAVFTFVKAPLGVVLGKQMTVITTNQERRNNMAKMGMDYLVEFPFNQEIAHMKPDVFVANVLVGKMNARVIVAGPDCSFGYKGAGNADLLKELAPKYGYEAVIIEKEKDEQRDISSTYIREELEQGNIEKANALLGEPYAIHGTVIHGNHIGGTLLGFPTANIQPPPEKHLPRFGVYVSRVLVDGKYYGGVSNIGRKPTIKGENPVGVETFIMGLNGDLNTDLYGKNIEVQLLNFERPEQRFENLEALKARIEKDKEYAAEYFRTHTLEQESQHRQWEVRDMSVERVREYLKQWNLQEKVKEFEVSSATVELAAQAVGCEPARIAKTMSFLVDGKAILILLAGDVKIDNHKYKERFHTKASMLKMDQLEELIGHPMGGVCPFNVKDAVDVYLDESLKRFDVVYPAAGSANSAVELTLEELEQASRAKGWVDVSKVREETA